MWTRPLPLVEGLGVRGHWWRRANDKDLLSKYFPNELENRLRFFVSGDDTVMKSEIKKTACYGGNRHQLLATGGTRVW